MHCHDFLPLLPVSCTQKWYHWLHRHNFLLGCIKLALFFFTFAISNAIFMAANFGPESCFFSRTGESCFAQNRSHSQQQQLVTSWHA